MAYSNHIPPYSTIPTFSPFYSSTIPPTYSTPLPTPPLTPNPSFPSYPHHLHHPSYHTPPSSPPSSYTPNPTSNTSHDPLYEPYKYGCFQHQLNHSSSPYGYEYHTNYYQHTSLSPSITTHNTTNTLQQQANAVHQPFYHQQPPNTSTPMYHHVGLPSSQNQNQNPTPTFVPPQTIPPSFPTHNYQQQPQSYSQPVATFQNPETNQNFMSKLSEILEKNNKFFSEIDEKYKQQKEESQRILDEKLQASRLALKEKLQQISDKYTKLKGSKQKIVVEENKEKTEIEGKTSPMNVVQEDLEDQRAKKGEPPKQPQQLPRPPVRKPPSELENGKNDYDYFLVSLPPVQLPSPAPETSHKPPETILAKPPASPPPPKPPDKTSTTVSIPKLPYKVLPLFSSQSSKSLPPKPPDWRLMRSTVSFRATMDFQPKLPRPPAKPPDLKTSVETPVPTPSFKASYLPPASLSPLTPSATQPPFSPIAAHLPCSTLFETFVLNEASDFPCLKGAPQTQSSPLDPHLVGLPQSQPYTRNTILVILISPLVVCHVSSYDSFTLCYVAPLQTQHVICFCPFPKLSSYHHLGAKDNYEEAYLLCQLLTASQHPVPMNWTSLFGLKSTRPKSDKPKVSPHDVLVGPPRICPTRKPPDLYLNLEDKVQVNPAAMIED